MDTLAWWSEHIFYVAIPYFLLGMAWEWHRLRRDGAGKRGYEARDTAVSLTLGVIKLGMIALCAGYAATLLTTAYEYRLFDLPPLAWWTWVLLFFGEDLAYYWYHRCAHRIRLFWAEHVNHHSSQYYNLGTALRQSALAPAYKFMYYLPLALIGFHPLAILVQASISLLYQFWIHTEAIGRLGWLEKVLNTPSHHRVHHGSNALYLDRNYGGILIIWDRLFGTFQEECADTPVRYGLVRDIHTYNPLRVIFHELAYLARQAWHAPRWREKLGWVLLPPEWKPQPRR
jgi:sterol desaturase/sphingolipid hydroxylase (fatty acid hydroxylase superfamily)